MQNPFRSAGPAPNSFLPQDYIARKSDAKANIFLLSFFAIVMAAVVGAFMVTYRQKVELRQHLVSVSTKYNAEAKKIEQLKQLETQRAQIMEKAQVTAALVERVPRWAVNQEIALRMAPTMRLHEFKIKCTRTDPKPAAAKDAPPPVKSLTSKIVGGKKEEPAAPTIVAPSFRYNLTIIGGAKENNDIADFIRSLRESPILDDVELAYIREGKGDEVLPRKFEISAILRSDTDPDALSKSLQGLLVTRTAMMGLTPDGKPIDQDKDQKPSLASTIGKLLGGAKDADKNAKAADKTNDKNGAVANAQENNP